MSNAKDIHATITPDDEPVLLEPGTTLANRYKLIAQIGRGGMGVVWSAEDKTAERKVVLKFVPREIEKFEESVAQLKASFNKIHELHHQHICPVYTLENDWEHGYYHVMKWLNGETLDQYIVRTVGRQQPLPFEEVLRILRPVAEALDYAHSKRIIHRDIKPSNIFIVLDEMKAITDVQVIDFGLASEIRSSLTRVSQMRFDTSGTRPYMAPEQWRGRPQSGQTDQYALAVVAHELLAGYLPFDGDDFEMLRAAVLQDTVEAIQDVPEHVNAALLTALAKDSGSRFRSCTEYVVALGGGEISIKPVPRPDTVKTSDVSGGRKTTVAPEAEPLMKRGHLFLEDSDWQQATQYFNRVLDIDAEYAPAYAGLLCAELKIRNEERLGDYEKPIAEYKNFQKSVRFADVEYKATVEGYDEKIRERIRQEQYDRLVHEKDRAAENDFPELAQKFRDMNGYKDTAKLADECDEQYRVLKEEREEQERQEQYDWLVQAKNKASAEQEYQELVEQFREMHGYRDTTELADECDEQYRVLKEERECYEAREREEQQRREEQELVRKEQKRQQQYQRLCEQYKQLLDQTKKDSSAENYRIARQQFLDIRSQCEEMRGYGSTSGLINACTESANVCEKQYQKLTNVVLSSKSTEFPFRFCPSGTFMMGSPACEAEGGSNETLHQVTLSCGFWMLKTPVTQGMWESVMGSNPSMFRGTKLPVEQVSWEDCQKYIQKLNSLDIAPKGYRFSLPTEAQWEYACRAGTTTPFHFGHALNGDEANYDGNYPYGMSAKGKNLRKTSDIGNYPANAWGLYDMHGNVFEWCADWYGNYPSGAGTDPTGPSFGSRRVLRGGSWSSFAKYCRSASRYGNQPSYRYCNIGVRLSLVRAE